MIVITPVADPHSRNLSPGPRSGSSASSVLVMVSAKPVRACLTDSSDNPGDISAAPAVETASLNVRGLRDRRAVRAERDFFHLGLGLFEFFLAMRL